MSSKQGMTITRREQLKGVLDRVIEAMAQKFLPEARKTLEKMPACAAFNKAVSFVTEFNGETERILQGRYKERQRKLESLGFIKDSKYSDDMKLRSNSEVRLSNVLDTYTDRASIPSSETKIVGGELVWNIEATSWPKDPPKITVPLFPPDIQAQITDIMDRFTLALSEEEAVRLIAEMGSLMETINAKKPSSSRRQAAGAGAAEAGKSKRHPGANTRKRDQSPL